MGNNMNQVRLDVLTMYIIVLWVTSFQDMNPQQLHPEGDSKSIQRFSFGAASFWLCHLCGTRKLG
jgi:hypothetical protein